MLIKTGHHAPSRARVDGALSNTPEFGQAFGCAVPDAMVRPPEKRCAVW
jgi:predicted metalloendopeptidase